MSSNYDGPRSYIQVAVLFVLFTLGWIPLVIAFLIGLIIDKKSQKPKM
jgi:phage shock protein PspC (stress-responsive transcriptional regulator)